MSDMFNATGLMESMVFMDQWMVLSGLIGDVSFITGAGQISYKTRSFSTRTVHTERVYVFRQ